MGVVFFGVLIAVLSIAMVLLVPNETGTSKDSKFPSAPIITWELIESLGQESQDKNLKTSLSYQRVRLSGYIFQWHRSAGVRDFLLTPSPTCFEDPQPWRTSSVILVRVPARVPKPMGCHPIVVEGTLLWDIPDAPNRRPILDSATVFPDWNSISNAPNGREIEKTSLSLKPEKI
jgi:hypothetical protein